MSFGFGFSLPSWQALSGGFSPASLFQGGTVAGAWYDPSDLSTLFDSSTGTTPVSMPGQGAAVPVGLMLDKSQGLVLGSELVSGTWANGTSFPFDTFTASGTGFTGNKTAFGISQAVLPAGASITSGALYRVELRITFADDDEITVNFQTSSGGGGVASSSSFSFGNISSTTTIVGYVRGTSTGTAYLQMSQQGTNRTLTVASVSVRAVPGNHAIAFNDSTKRPVLMARVNLLTYSEQFDNGAWVATNATKGTTTGTRPDGTTGTVHSLTLQGATTSYVYQTNSFASGQTATFAIYVRLPSGSTATDVRLTTNNTLSWNTGISQKFALTSSWQRLLLSGAVTTTGTLVSVIVGNTDAAGNRDASIPAGVIEIWGADLRPANIGANVPAYQRIADALTYDTNGFPLYLYFDGADDSMYTPANLNLSGTDKVAVFAGVRKLADTRGSITELSANAGTNNGSFNLFASVAGAARWFSALRGTAFAYYEPQTYTAPITNVLSTSFDIAGASISNEIVPRVNGIVEQDNPSGANAGTGNFGTYPLYIGSRNNSSDWLNGQVYGLLVVGSAVSAGNISATEQWVAGRTGIQI